ncbi:hypothetical protein BDV35DRAFT_341783 [Aspergillus flavus]|uniref:Uncharacterized protein n=1 Tax=Aspergillus flavus TaxID=5059 RepID=A0A5N6HDK1_ASPFL|nr:hypothetical protein BDV35DRAFT_341783 [Aspergillus flavus]
MESSSIDSTKYYPVWDVPSWSAISHTLLIYQSVFDIVRLVAMVLYSQKPKAM